MRGGVRRAGSPAGRTLGAALAAATVLALTGCTSKPPVAGPPLPTPTVPAPTGPALLDALTVPYHPDGVVVGIRVATPLPLTELAPEDPPSTRTRYVGWDRCEPGCGVTGPYDVETRRLLAQALPGRYPVPSGTALLVLAVQMDAPPPTGCVEVPALGVTTTSGARYRLTGRAGAPVVRVCPA